MQTPILFIACTLLSAYLFQRATNSPKTFWSISLVWWALNNILARWGFYEDFTKLPPNFLLAVLPPFVLVIYLIFKNHAIVQNADLEKLTYLHAIRVPVEIGLLWLFQAGTVPQEMTFEGRNFDILAGITAPFVAYWVFRRGGNKKILLAWNFLALGLLINIVATAFLSTASPIQQFGFGQPNVAVALSPYILLPAYIVPIVLFSHLIAIKKLLSSSQNKS